MRAWERIPDSQPLGFRKKTLGGVSPKTRQQRKSEYTLPRLGPHMGLSPPSFVWVGSLLAGVKPSEPR